MQVETEIKKWGNSLALRISGVMADLPKFSMGTKVIVDVSEEGLLIRPVVEKSKKFRLPYREKDLLAELTSASVHADKLASLTSNDLEF
jgi:antitoxin MazE